MTVPTGQVDIPALTKIGGTVTAAANAITQAHTAQADILAPGDALAGWATQTALGAASQSWATFVRTLAGQVRSFGTDLTTSARDYRATDDAAAARLRASGTGPVPR